MRKQKTEQQGSQDSLKVKLPQSLVRGLDSEEYEEFVYAWTHSADLREKVAEVLTKSLDNAILQAENEELLDSPNYVGKLADLNGYRRGLRQAINLISKGPKND